MDRKTEDRFDNNEKQASLTEEDIKKRLHDLLQEEKKNERSGLFQLLLSRIRWQQVLIRSVVLAGMVILIVYLILSILGI